MRLCSFRGSRVLLWAFGHRRVEREDVSDMLSPCAGLVPKWARTYTINHVHGSLTACETSIRIDKGQFCNMVSMPSTTDAFSPTVMAPVLDFNASFPRRVSAFTKHLTSVQN
jgi:hypothetical protein